MKSEMAFKKIGFISKLNGFSGELVLATNEDDFFDEKFLFISMDGIEVPFLVVDIFEKGGNVIVKFEDINDEHKAQLFLKKNVFKEQKKSGKKEKHQFDSAKGFQDFRIIDAVHGDLGPIIRIDEFPQQEIAVCNVKGKEVLIPLNEDFIDSIDEDGMYILMTLPAGLIDLYIE